jgi:hypothetical protein
VIVAVVETLEINLVEIKPRAQIFEHLGSAVAVGNESSKKTLGPSFFKNRDGPFTRDQWLVVGADKNFGALVEGVANQVLGYCIERRGNCIRISQSLRGDPVLTVSAVQIASQHAEAVGEGAGMSVEEWLLFNGIALHPGGVAPRHVKSAAAVVANFAYAGLAIRNRAAMTAGKTADAIVVQFFVKRRIRFADSLV